MSKHHISKRAARRRRIKQAKHLRQFRQPDYSQWSMGQRKERDRAAGLLNFIFGRMGS